MLTEKVIGAAIEVHRHLGPGLLESTYEMCLAKEFEIRKISYEKQKTYPLTYKDLSLMETYRVDFLIETHLILEIKAVEHLLPIHSAQLMSYLRLLKHPIGLLINFNVPVLKEGIRRISLI